MGDIPASYVSLPEGSFLEKTISRDLFYQADSFNGRLDFQGVDASDNPMVMSIRCGW